MQSLYNEEQRKKITKCNSRNHTEIIKRHERSQDFLVQICVNCVYCVNCTKFGQLILMIIIKIDATRCQILRLKCKHQNRFRLGLRPSPRWGSLRRFPKPPSRLGGDRRLGRVHSRAFGTPLDLPYRLWRRLCLCLLCKLHKIWSVDSHDIIKIDATRCQILRLKCTKIVVGWGSAPVGWEGIGA